MCADGWYNFPRQYKEEDLPLCPDCDEYVDEDGAALSGCCYSPVQCETCGAAPCQQYC